MGCGGDFFEVSSVRKFVKRRVLIRVFFGQIGRSFRNYVLVLVGTSKESRNIGKGDWKIDYDAVQGRFLGNC